MSRMVILMLLASLGAVQADDCGDKTSCEDYVSFCGKADGTDRYVCYPLISDPDILCGACNPTSEACVPSFAGQAYCTSSFIDNCQTGSCPSGLACVSAASNKGACFPLANPTGSVPCYDDKTFCNAGQGCYGADDDKNMTCATLAGNDALCAACKKNNMECYQGTQPAQAACLEYVDCAKKCSDTTTQFCAKKKADGTGVCLTFST